MCSESRARSFTAQRSARGSVSQLTSRSATSRVPPPARTHHHAPQGAVQRHHHAPRSAVLRGRAQPLRLAHGVARDARVPADHIARRGDDLARFGRLRAQLGHQVGVAALRHETDVLAVRLARHRQAQPCRRPPGPPPCPACRRAETGCAPVAPAWWRTGTSSGRAPGRRRGATRPPPAPRRGARNGRWPGARRPDRRPGPPGR